MTDEPTGEQVPIELAVELTDDLLMALQRFAKVRPNFAFEALLRDNERIRKLWESTKGKKEWDSEARRKSRIT